MSTETREKIVAAAADLVREGGAVMSVRAVAARAGVGARTPPEIAVSICAELVAHRNLGEVPGRPRGVEVP